MWEEKTFEPDIKECEEVTSENPFEYRSYVDKTAIQKLADFLNETNIRDFNITSKKESFPLLRASGDSDIVKILYFNKYAPVNRQI